ncbi:Mitochondrial phosphate carrier protein 1 [Hibiscus syriacus]|uniref:Mitochondrial phosphate carrier protein 1 n=1 Tax=Hibiscus syriacus TaxID=106335 RepID=A0A6A2X7J5_HIBSY|nr:Mitochondrial phosphate carrier protein 1 [Hibiscus syriacus]
MKYTSISSGFSALWREQGPSSLWRGWSGKLFGYGVQGGCRFGLYEYFKELYSNVWLIKTRPSYSFSAVHLLKSLLMWLSVLSKPLNNVLSISQFDCIFYKGLGPLWGRNLPFSMIMFSTFEHSVDFIYGSIKQRKEDCSRAQQLGVTCLAGYAAGAVGTVVSNPADVVVSSLYNKKAENVFQAVRKIGLVNLFTRSLPVRITVVGPVITLQWFFL